MAVVGDNIPGCTGTGEANNPYIYSDANGFIAAVGVLGAYVEADTANEFFDFNSVSYTLPIEINCLSLKAKNTTLFNVLSTDGSSIIKFDKEKKSNRVIDHLNIYNFCMILYSNSAGEGTQLLESAWMSSDQACLVKCTSCNFAGVVIGYSATTTGLSGRSTLIGYHASSINYYSHVFVFENCTFNVHLKDTTNTASSFTFASFGGYGSPSSMPPSAFKNCTVCISGDVPNKAVYIGGNSVALNNVTLMNDESNPLRCAWYHTNISNNDASGYNYHKNYVSTTSTLYDQSIYINDRLGLINRTRFKPYNNQFVATNLNLVMQEYDISNPDQFLLSSEPADWSTDWTKYFTKFGNVYTHVTGDTAPTFAINTYYDVPTDYIYLEENLIREGFIVGQVII